MMAPLCLLAVGHASAAIIQTFTDKTTFLAAVDITAGETVTFGPSGPGATIDLTDFALTAGAGLLELEASPAGLFGTGTILSTDADHATLILHFLQPLRAIGLTSFIGDEAFASITGSLRFEAVGSSSRIVPVTNGVPAFFGLQSDTDFSIVQIAIETSDLDGTAIATVALTDTAYLDVSAQNVPGPGLTALFAPALAFVFARWRRGNSARVFV